MRTKLSRLGERRKQISILLTIIALLLWSHSILYAKFDIGYWGLIGGLPITFFVALALLTVASAILWVSREKHGQLLCLQLLILILALDLVPLVTGGSAPFINSGYRSLGYVDYIVTQGHFDTQVTFYLSWPGAFVLPAVIGQIGLIDFAPLVEILPVFLPILFLLPLYIFLRNTLGENRSNYIWAGCWLFYLADWTGPGNLISAPGIAAFLLLVILALVTNPRIWQKDGKSLVILVLIVIAFTAMVTSHLLTSLAALGIMAALSLVRRDRRLALATIVCLAILLAWNLTVASTYVQNRLPIIFSEGKLIFNPAVLAEREVTLHLFGSGPPGNIAKIKLVHAVLFALIGLAGLISTLITRKELKTTVSLLAITLIPISLIVLSGYYTREILNRIYAFVLPGMAYFGARLFDVNKRVVATVLCLLLIIAIPISMITTYGNQEWDYFSPAQRQGTFFFHDKTSQGLVFSARPMGMVKDIEHYDNIRLGRLEWDDNQIVVAKWLTENLPYYIGLSRQDRALFEWFLGDIYFIPDIEQRLQNTVSLNFIYNNPDLDLYIYEGE